MKLHTIAVIGLTMLGLGLGAGCKTAQVNQAAEVPREQFTVWCDGCQKDVVIVPCGIINRGGSSTDTGLITDCTLSYVCPLCGTNGTANTQIFKPHRPIATPMVESVNQ